MSNAAVAARTGAQTIGVLLETCAGVIGGGIAARREAADIVAAILDVPRFWPASNASAVVEDTVRDSVLAAAGRRARGAPFAYAVRRAAFRHLTLVVDERVLIPRPETEMLVDVVLARSAPGAAIVADIGTGSGAIALSLACERKFVRVIATDVSRDALTVAQMNLERVRDALQSPVELRHGSLFAPLRGERLDVIVSNPPYISFAEAAELPASVRDWEPVVALMTGDGLNIISEVVRGAPEYLQPQGLLALEVDARRAHAVRAMLAGDARYHEVEILLDLTGRERFVAARRT